VLPPQVYRDADALRWCIELAEALRYLHSRTPKVIHRDVKLDNVLLTGRPGRGRAVACLRVAAALAGAGRAGLWMGHALAASAPSPTQSHAHTHIATPNPAPLPTDSNLSVATSKLADFGLAKLLAASWRRPSSTAAQL
jgi:serine/threonine protein kinase